VKLCDFQYMRAAKTLVTKINGPDLAFMPPEICTILMYEKYYCDSSIDVWQMGILLIVSLRGCTPWKTADELKDPTYHRYNNWVKRKSVKVPEVFESFTPRFMRLLRRLMEPKILKRCKVEEVMKYMKNQWLISGAINNNHESIKDRSQSQDGTGTASKEPSPGGIFSVHSRGKSLKQERSRSSSAGLQRTRTERSKKSDSSRKSASREGSTTSPKVCTTGNRSIVLYPLALTEVRTRKNSETAW